MPRPDRSHSGLAGWDHRDRGARTVETWFAVDTLLEFVGLVAVALSIFYWSPWFRSREGRLGMSRDVVFLVVLA